MPNIRSVSALILALFSLAVLHLHAQPSLQEAIAQAAAIEMESSGTPSLQIAVGYKSELLFEGAYGWADLENRVPATVHTRYRTASVSKWFTATAAFALAAEDRLDLDAPIQQYCPVFSPKPWPITTRQLLAHTSGIRHYIDFEQKIAEAATPEEREQWENRSRFEQLRTYTRHGDLLPVLDAFKDDPLLFEPGTRWQYSSFGYRLLGCVIEGAAGESYNDVMRRYVFEPALMRSTLPDDAWAIIPHRSSGYRLQRGQPLRRADMRDVSENLPAGGHLSTASDLARFAMAFHNGEMLLPERFKNLMASRPNGEPLKAEGEASWRHAIPSEEHYGHGLMAFPGSQGFWIGHTGRQAGGSAIVIVAPENRWTIAVMTNAKGWNGFVSFVQTLETLVADAVKSGS